MDDPALYDARVLIRPTDFSAVLVCHECVQVSDDHAEGWRAFLGTEDDDTEVLVVLCPRLRCLGRAALPIARSL